MTRDPKLQHCLPLSAWGMVMEIISEQQAPQAQLYPNCKVGPTV